MKQAFYAIASGVILTALSVLSLGVHTISATPRKMEPLGSVHGATTSACTAVCVTATLQKEDIVTDVDKEDDEPEPPFYAQFQPSPLDAIEEQHNQEARSARNMQQPPGAVPVYILMNVFRI